MKCQCGYQGEPEYGTFPFGVNLEQRHMRCPKCKNTESIIFESWERVKMAILYPEFCSGGPDWLRIHGFQHIKTRKAIYVFSRSYTIACPVCSWGEGGGLPPDKAKELQALFVEAVRA